MASCPRKGPSSRKSKIVKPKTSHGQNIKSMLEVKTKGAITAAGIVTTTSSNDIAINVTKTAQEQTAPSQ